MSVFSYGQVPDSSKSVYMFCGSGNRDNVCHQCLVGCWFYVMLCPPVKLPVRCSPGVFCDLHDVALQASSVSSVVVVYSPQSLIDGGIWRPM